MMHQQWDLRSGAESSPRGTETSPISVLAYRSRAVTAPTRAGLDEILRSAQQRNRESGLTGLLIYDRGHYYQWLEGPKAALTRVWDSIRRDNRHSDFKILRQQSVPLRFFEGWDMRLGRRTRGEIDEVLKVMEGPQELLARLGEQPTVLPGGVWDKVFSDAVIPRLRLVSKFEPVRRVAPAIWHAEIGAAATLAGILLAVDPHATGHYVDGLIEEGAELEGLYREVFEPAARCLGGLWDDDRCDEFNVTLALGRLQVEARRISRAFATGLPGTHPGHAVLISPQPGESHSLNASLCSELFYRDGWYVTSEFPRNDNALRTLLHEQWFDVLELSQSAALRRDQQLPALRLTILAARAASLNPALAIIVDGRTFFDRPQAYRDVGADVGCVASTDAVPAAQQLVDRIARLAGRLHGG
jgi:hypothetical protein